MKLLLSALLSLFAYSSSAGESLKIASIQSLITKNHITRIEDLLPLLPEEFRSRYILAYETRSPQYSSYEDPRVIFFGKDASLTLAFGGDTGTPGEHKVELIENTDGDSQSAEITFFEDPKKEPKFEKNPESCIECHGSPPKLNWDTYNLWPGMYGSKGGSLIAADSEEDAGFRRFLAKHEGKKDAYANLPGLTQLSQIPKSGNYRINLNAKGEIGGGDLILNDAFSGLASFQNFKKLHKLLRSYDFKHYRYAFLAALSNCNDMDTYFPESNKDKPVSYIDTLKETLSLNEKFVRAKFARQGDKNQAKDAPRLGGPKPYAGADGAETVVGLIPAALELPVAKLRYVLLRQGKNMDDWFLACRDPNSYLFDMAAGFHNPLWGKLAKEILDQEPEFSTPMREIMGASFPPKADYSEYPRDLAYPPYGPASGLCALLKKKSLAAFGIVSPKSLQASSNCVECKQLETPAVLKNYQNGVFSQAQEAANALHLQPFSKCIACHTGEQPKGGFLPFDSPEHLTAELARPESRLMKNILDRIDPDKKPVSKRMPKGEPPLSEEERKQVKELLESSLRVNNKQSKFNN